MFSIIRLDNFEPEPGTVSYDLVANNHLSPDFDIPVWVSMAYWVVSADGGDGFSMSINYVDPTGQTRSIDGSTIGLGDSAAFVVVPVTPIQRLSDSSLVEVTATNFGSGAGSPLVAARIMVGRMSYEQIVAGADWTP